MRPVLRWLIAAAMLGVPMMMPAQQRAPKAAAPQTYDRCMAVATTNVAFSDCGTKELERQEALLTDAWKAANASFGASLIQGPDFNPAAARSKQALLAEQRAWIRYKDLSCLHLYEGAGREGQVIHFPMCRIKVIADRVTYLRENFVSPPTGQQP